MNKDYINAVAGVLLFAAIFVAASYLVQTNSELIGRYIHNDYTSMLFYILVLILSAVIAPVDVLFLLPAATTSWSWHVAGALSLLGWTLGSAAVFIIARKLGTPIINRHRSLQRVNDYVKYMPKNNIFAGIVFLRIAIPIDLVSYAIALFTDIQFIPYITATFIGFLPLAFVLAYLGTLPFNMQIISFLIFIVVIITGKVSYSKIKRKTKY
ncbi:MAG: VTT domain-containing protein [archaeon]